MNEQPLISVIVPCYNVEKYLNKCVDSILKQTYKNIEVILVDDGSPDKCGEICDFYAKQDDRVVVIHKKNGGLSDARNVALDIAKGEYVTFVDSDDWVDDDYVEYLYKMIEKDNSLVSIACYRCVKNSKEINKKIQKEEINYLPSKSVIEDIFYQRKSTGAHAKMYSKKLFSSIRFPKGIIFEDLAIIYQVLLKVDMVSVSNRYVYSYLLRDDSIQGEFFSEQKYKSTMYVKDLLERDKRLLVLNKSLTSRLFSFMFRLYLSMPTDEVRKKEIWKYLCLKRWDVIIDRNARVKNRLAAFLSYFGDSIVLFVYKKIRIR